MLRCGSWMNPLMRDLGVRDIAASSGPITLARILGLRPLDRIQVSSAREIAEMYMGLRPGQPAELPFMYFQRVLPDGRFELRSPGGYATNVNPAEVCDVIPGSPIMVRAMPRAVFEARLKLPLLDRQKTPGPESYVDAYVLYIAKDRWGRVDQVFVWFADDSLNGDKPWAAPVHGDDRRALDALRRTSLPVFSKHAGALSADTGVASSIRLADDTVSTFMRAALRGEKTLVSAIAGSGLRPLSRAAVGKLGLKTFVACKESMAEGALQ